jgi:uncharacterized membrane protein
MNPEENKTTGQNNAPQQNVPQSTPPVKATVNHGLIFGILSYLGLLVIISFIFGKADPFVKFHVKQGLTIVCLDVIGWILNLVDWHLWPVVSVLNLAALILSIVGIVNVFKRREKELPWIGQFAKHFTF